MAGYPHNSQNPQLPKLNGKNYHHWSIQMKVLFQSQELWDVVEEKFEEPDAMDEISEYQETEIQLLKKKDRKALYLIYQSVDEVILERISSSNSTSKCEFDNLKMIETESIEDFCNRGSSFLNKEEGSEDDNMFTMLSTQEIERNDTWYVDSGCNNHMAGKKGIFVQIDETRQREVRTGDNNVLKVNGIGDIIVDTKIGQKMIQNVYYVLGLKYNLLSVVQLL
ncbi:hypothetical protein LXL04_035025 [Taraxacum kok-saghyz]